MKVWMVIFSFFSLNDIFGYYLRGKCLWSQQSSAFFFSLTETSLHQKISLCLVTVLYDLNVMIFIQDWAV